MKYYYYVKDDQQFGPFTIEELKLEKLKKDTLVWADGMSDWSKADEVEELKGILISDPPPLFIRKNTPPPIPTNDTEKFNEWFEKDGTENNPPPNKTNNEQKDGTSIGGWGLTVVVTITLIVGLIVLIILTHDISTNRPVEQNRTTSAVQTPRENIVENPSETANMRFHRSTRHNFSIRHPNNWTIVEDYNQMLVFKAMDERSGKNFNIVIINNARGSLEQLVNAGIADMRRTFTDARVLERTNLQINGMNTIRVNVQATNLQRTGQQFNSMYSFLHNNRLYIVNFGSDARDTNSYKDLIRRIISSFRITGYATLEPAQVAEQRRQQEEQEHRQRETEQRLQREREEIARREQVEQNRIQREREEAERRRQERQRLEDRARAIGGIIINDVIWATRNVDAPGTFVRNPENIGMFFQWNRRRGWPATGNVTGWDSSNPTGTIWTRTNDPCPQGWRIPTRLELQQLVDVGSIWTTRNGVNGRLFGIAPNQIFMPVGGVRDRDSTRGGVGSLGVYWSSTYDGATTVPSLTVTNNRSNVESISRAWGANIRCVAE